MDQYEVLVSATARFARSFEMPHSEQDDDTSLLERANMTEEEIALISLRDGFEVVSVTPEPGLGGVKRRKSMAHVDVEAVVNAEGILVVEAESEENARALFYEEYAADPRFAVFERTSAGGWLFDHNVGLDALSFSGVQTPDGIQPAM